MTRIAYVCADRGVPVFGRSGSSVHVQSMVRALARARAEVVLFATLWDGDPPPDFPPVVRHALPPPPEGDTAERERASLAANPALEAALEAAGPFDVVYERWSLWSTAAMKFARDRRIPALLEVNSPLIEQTKEHRRLVDEAGAARCRTLAMSRADAILAISSEVAAWLGTLPEAEGRVHVVPCGVDAGRFRPDVRPARPKEEGTFVVGFVGTFKPWHDLETLAEGFARFHAAHPGARLHLVGDGPGVRPLRESLARLGAAHVASFSGSVDPASVPSRLAAMDVVMAPYPPGPCWFSPLKVFEALAMEKAVVSNAVGQIGEYVENGKEALLVPPGDPQALAEALARLHDDPAMRLRLGKAGRERVLVDLTWDRIARRVLEIAESVGRGGRGR